jgi:hypothetical protein
MDKLQVVDRDSLGTVGRESEDDDVEGKLGKTDEMIDLCSGDAEDCVTAGHCIVTVTG